MFYIQQANFYQFKNFVRDRVPCRQLFGSHQRLSSAMYAQAGNTDLSTQCEIK